MVLKYIKSKNLNPTPTIYNLKAKKWRRRVCAAYCIAARQFKKTWRRYIASRNGEGKKIGTGNKTTEARSIKSINETSYCKTSRQRNLRVWNS